jgi:hypothetical protein
MFRLLAESGDAELVVTKEGSSRATRMKKPAVPEKEDR